MSTGNMGTGIYHNHQSACYSERGVLTRQTEYSGYTDCQAEEEGSNELSNQFCIHIGLVGHEV